MEVTRHNFNELFDVIEKQLRESCLVGFDAEFTALPSHDAIRPRLFDNGVERYERLRDAVATTVMTQVGLTLYKYEREDSVYRTHTYTFHLRPQAVGDINQTFLFQASTLHFLCRHKFDFNKFIYDGIPYLSRSEVSHLRELQQQGQLLDTLHRALEIEQDRELQQSCSTLSKWLSSSSDENEEERQDTLYLEPSTAVLRYLLHRELRIRFPAVLTTDSLGATDKVLVFRNKDVSGARNTPDKEIEERLMNDLTGFSRVVELLAHNKKPLVGHNMYLDMILLHNQFHGPLPKSYSQFKNNLRELVPSVYDTKYISQQMNHMLSFDEVWKSNALQDLYEFFKENKVSRLSKCAADVRASTPFQHHQSYHEAGWDSYCAGYLLLRLGAWAASEVAGRGQSVGPVQMLAVLRQHCNKVNLMRCSVPYMNMDGEDPPQHRPCLVYVRALRTKHIDVTKVAALLSGYGALDVQAYGTRAVLVAPATQRTAENILHKFSSTEYRASVYSVFRHSPAARVAIWSGALMTGTLMLLLLHKKMS